MVKNTTIFTLLSNFISQEEIDEILAELQFEDKARKCDVPTLLNYLVGAATFEWKSMRHAADVAPAQGLKSVDYSTLSKRLSELNYLIVKRIFELIVSRLNRSARRSLKLKKELLAIDSTTITVGKNRLPWALYHGNRSGIKLHVSFTNQTCILQDKNAENCNEKYRVLPPNIFTVFSTTHWLNGSSVPYKK